jgi:hypothetical protein
MELEILEVIGKIVDGYTCCTISMSHKSQDLGTYTTYEDFAFAQDMLPGRSRV